MTLRKVYFKLFPAPIARRMIEQSDLNCNPVNTTSGHILNFGRWFKTEEGRDFWDAMHGLYTLHTFPTEDQIKDVFAAHNIPYE